eukprot:SAG31_NODE_1473_length_8207_cov_2.716330_7_plen_93_part_00
MRTAGAGSYRVTLSRLAPDFSVRTREIQQEKSHKIEKVTVLTEFGLGLLVRAESAEMEESGSSGSSGSSRPGTTSSRASRSESPTSSGPMGL